MALEVIDADELSRRGEIDTELDRGGRPLRPMIFVRPGAGRFLAPRTGAGARPIVVLVRDRPGTIDDALARFVDLTLAARGVEPTAVELHDPWDGARRLAASSERAPCAALTLAQLLRVRSYEDVARGLFAESVAYSMLQAGAEFASWRALRQRRAALPGVEEPRIRVELRDGVLAISLSRAHRRNALDLRMRDELLAALAPAVWDRTLSVVLSGEGPTFCAGGDLDEFGSFSDPPSAHLVRLAAGLAEVLHDLRDRVTVRVHGHCHGAGVELAAFAGHVVAAPDTRFSLPEVAMGLIPGAGGTTSLPRRIGVGRTLWLALSGDPLDAHAALEWGLVDAVE